MPPEGGIFKQKENGNFYGNTPAKSIGDLVDYLQSWAKAQGFAVIRKQARKQKIINDEKVYTRYSILCDRDRVRNSESTGIRRSRTQKNNCPFKLTASARKADDWRWKWEYVNYPFGFQFKVSNLDRLVSQRLI